jgi:GNAT superfamily N-acetyltransferase
VIVDTDPRSPRGQEALTAYTDEVQAAAGLKRLNAADAEAFLPPTGAFLLAVEDEQVVGCIGLRRLSADEGELKRMWVRPSRRRLGIGAMLLTAAEQRAFDLGYRRLLLDTHESLIAAIHFYTNRDYLPVPRFNENPDATHFFARTLP